jgi:heme-degrading monooxygenase HmoA
MTPTTTTPTPTSTSTSTSTATPGCLELATFKARPGTDPAEVGRALAAAQAWLAAQPGFLSRRLLRDEAQETWVDEIGWRSAEEAHRAGEAFRSSPVAAAIDRVIDTSTFRCLHAAPVPLPAAP